MKVRYLLLLAAFSAARAFPRVVLLYVDNPEGARVSTALSLQASLLDGATDPVLWDRPDSSPCDPGGKPTEGRFLERAESPRARSVAVETFSNLPGALSAVGAKTGEVVTLYSLSWERRLELRGGTAVIPFPTEATIPEWVRTDFTGVTTAISAWAVKEAEPSALLLYADLGGTGLGPEQWRQWGVKIPSTAPTDGAPFLTRQDFVYRPSLSKLTLGESRASRPHRVRFYVRSPWTGGATCAAARAYPEFKWERLRQESQLLSALTGWSIATVLSKSGISPPKSEVPFRSNP